MWGASTASHQVEGNNHNNWTVWELENAARLAKGAKKQLGHLSNWEDIRQQATDPENYISGRGVEHFIRYEEDFDLVKELNLNTLRFSIEWSRLEPEPGQWDQAAIDHYKRYIAALKKRGITPLLNLWHWSHPVWFEEAGGFSKQANLRYFERYAKKVGDELLGGVEYVVTINEPNVFVGFAYLVAERPPQEKNFLKGLYTYWNLTKAHKRAYRVLKTIKPSLHVGVAAQLANIQPKRPHNIIDFTVTKWMRYAWNWWFLNRIRRYQDFIGFNYYFTDYYRGVKSDNPKVPMNDMGFYMEPEGLYPLLVRIAAHYKLPIIITENGVADATDQYRQWWLDESMLALTKAIDDGIDVRGYLHWGLLDNFEWSFGWWPKFGLIEVNRQTMRRTIRPSARKWAEQLEDIQKS